MVEIVFFFLLFRVAENYWYSYDGMASEPARRLLLLPSSVSSVISVVIYICFSLLRVTNGSELTSEDDNLEPKIDDTSSKKRKPCSTINVESDEEKLKKKPTRKDSKACSTGDLLNNELWVTSYELWVTSYELHFVSYELHFMSYELHFMSYELHFMSYELHFMSYELWVTFQWVMSYILWVTFRGYISDRRCKLQVARYRLQMGGGGGGGGF